MKAWISPYQLSLMAMVCVVVLFLVQTLVGLIFRMRAGQVPGMPIDGGHDVFLFRADRARSNLIEVLGPFVLVLVIGILQQASPSMINVAACVFAGGRLLHMLAYYANRTVLRRIGFMAGNIATLVGVIACMRTW